MKPRRHPDISTTLLPDGYVVLFNKNNDWVHVVSPVGAMAWEFCDGEHSLAEIANEISQLLPDQSATVLEDQIGELIADLAKRGLLLET